MGETNLPSLGEEKESVAVDTFGGRVHVEWDPAGAATPLGQLAFFIEFLTLLLSVLAGHKRYAHITSIRCDSVNPDLLGMDKVMSEDAVRRTLMQMDERLGVEWLQLYDGQYPSYSGCRSAGWQS